MPAALALAVLAAVLRRRGARRRTEPLGVIDSQRIAEEYEAARDAQEQYQKFLRELELEVADREKQLTAMAEEIESQKMLLGEDALATKIAAVRAEAGRVLPVPRGDRPAGRAGVQGQDHARSSTR